MINLNNDKSSTKTEPKFPLNKNSQAIQLPEIKITASKIEPTAAPTYGVSTIPTQSEGGSSTPNSATQNQNYTDDFSKIFDAGATTYGAAEKGIQSVRQSNNGAQALGRAIGYGTKQTAKALSGTLNAVSKVAKGLGVAGYVLQTASIASKIVNGEEISTAEKVSFAASTSLVVAGVLTAGSVVAAPIVATAALVYGLAELTSYFFTGQSLEEHLFPTYSNPIKP
jgi:hypothetical protein